MAIKARVLIPPMVRIFIGREAATWARE